MNILVACEESQVVTIAFRNRGHNAFSCDIQKCSGDHPEWHIQGDVTRLINGRCSFTTCTGQKYEISDTWDMIIAFPPCTFLTKAGACNIPKDPSRIEKGFSARDFFMLFYRADCPRVCIENPIPMKRFDLPEPSQHIEPYYFGHPYSKYTYLWLKGLPNLFFTCYCPDFCSWVKCKRGDTGNGHRSSKLRSKTFPGIAAAMAQQWG